MISKHPQWQSYRQAPITGSWFKRFLKSRFRYVDYPFVIAFRGFASADVLIVQGYVFKGMAISKPTEKAKSLKNLINLIKMFLVRTVGKAQLELVLNNQNYRSHSNESGFFEFEIKDHKLAQGWHGLKLSLESKLVEGQEAITLKPQVLVAHAPKRIIVSDIDDTLLVSHISKTFRKIYLLIARNSESRKPFKGVVSLYQKLSANQTNPFFYVSSSEWNLYEFLRSFMRFHHLPKGVFQLKELKDHWTDFFKSGYGNHNHKQDKIERLLAMYPSSKFVLIGDNSQQDPMIYRRLAHTYPGQIEAVLIRGINTKKFTVVNALLKELEEKDIPYFQFKNSQEAQEFCQNLGLI